MESFLFQEFTRLCEWVFLDSVPPPSEGLSIKEQILPILFVLFAHVYKQLDHQWAFFNNFHMGFTLAEISRIATYRVQIWISASAYETFLLQIHPDLKTFTHKWIEFKLLSQEELSPAIRDRLVFIDAVSDLRVQAPSQSALYKAYMQKKKEKVAVPSLPAEWKDSVTVGYNHIHRSDTISIASERDCVVAAFKHDSPRVWVQRSKGGMTGTPFTLTSPSSSSSSSSYLSRCVPTHGIAVYQQTVITAAQDGLLLCWRPVTATSSAPTDSSIVTGYQCVKQYATYENVPIEVVSFAPDGILFATGSGSKTGDVQIWDVEKSEAKTTFRGGYEDENRIRIRGHINNVNVLAWHPYITYLCSGSRDQFVYVWDIQSATKGRMLTGFNISLTSLLVHPAGLIIVGGSVDGRIFYWDALSGKIIHIWSHPERFAIYSLSYSGTAFLAAAAGPEVLIFHDMTTEHPVRYPMVTPPSKNCTVIHVNCVANEGMVMAAGKSLYE